MPVRHEAQDSICHVLVNDLGLVPGQPRTAARGNSIGMALAWLAVVKAGLVAVATMPLLRARELAVIIESPARAGAVRDASLLAELQMAQRDHAVLSSIVAFNSSEPRRTGGPGTRDAPRRAPFAACPTAAQDVRAAGIHLRHHRPAKGRAYAPRPAGCVRVPGRATCCACPDDIVVGSPPLASPSAWGLLIFPCGRVRRSIFQTLPTTPEAMVQQMRLIGATICYTAPTFYRPDGAVCTPVHGPCPVCASASAPARRCPTPHANFGKRPQVSKCSTASAPPEMFHIFISSAGADVRQARWAGGAWLPACVVDDTGASCRAAASATGR